MINPKPYAYPTPLIQLFLNHVIERFELKPSKVYFIILNKEAYKQNLLMLFCV